jgi:hypothetical protein
MRRPGALPRLVLALGCFIAVPVVYLISFTWIEEIAFPADRTALLASDVVTGALFLGAWILIWRNRLVWTTRVVLKTVLCVLAGLVAGGLAHSAFVAQTSRLDNEGIIFGGLAWLAVVVGGTGLIWFTEPASARRFESADDSRPVTCPKCGYNMTGLKQARCPECGTQYTLDELFTTLLPEDEQLD